MTSRWLLYSLAGLAYCLFPLIDNSVLRGSAFNFYYSYGKVPALLFAVIVTDCCIDLYVRKRRRLHDFPEDSSTKKEEDDTSE